MAKKESILFPIKDSSPIDKILEIYGEHLKNDKELLKDKGGDREDTIEQYKMRVPNAHDIISKTGYASEAEKYFLYLLPIMIVNGDKDKIIKLLKLIRSSAEIHNWGSKRSYKCYITTFIDYLEKIIRNKKNFEELSNQLAITENYQNDLNIPEIYFHGELEDNFCWRLDSQNRTSGDKIWLPLKFIKQIFVINGKEYKNKYDKWIKSLFDNIYVHYIYNDNNNTKKIGSKKLKEKVFIELEINSNGKDVWLLVPKENKKYRVLTPTGKGNGKEPMTVDKFKQIAIDHVKSIDKILRDLEKDNKLKMLSLVSEKYKELAKEKNKKKISTKYLKTAAYDLKDSIIIDELYKELKRIKKAGPLRLMKSEYNSQKSNNETFDIYQKKGSDDEYIGILGKKIKIGNNLSKSILPNLDLTLYQKLNDDLDNAGVFYIDYIDEDSLSNDYAPYTGKLDTIINYI